MIKHFYSYHVEIESIVVEINSLPIEKHEKKHLIYLAESQVHHAILDSILSQLAPSDKKLFISHLNSKDHERIWKFLRSKVQDIEEKIEQAANSIKAELHKDINLVRTSESNKK